MNYIRVSYYSALLLISLLLASCNSTKSHISNYNDVYFEKSGIDREKHRIGNTPVKNNALYLELRNWLGAPYRYGGKSPAGTDCSGMVMTVYKKVYGKKLERNSAKIFSNNCIKIHKSELREGDLVFFSTSKNKNKINHVGIYLNNRRFIHASTSKGVIISSLDEKYYQRTYIGAGRVK